ncbi:MAG: site-2 protease family protein [Puniceicoccales bacterium]|jgi:Zn-dependent protease|nr:site-2 protease family protein [Puniceicoccales bacterium]
MDAAQLAQSGIIFIVLLASLALHEFAHAWVADKRGDPLPRQQGRVTLDPFAHLDPIGSFLIPGLMIFAGPGIALFGWAKPVPISLPNPKTQRIDDILITLAGPGMNLLIASVMALAIGLLEHPLPTLTERALAPALLINLALVLFNLLPIPPLDGSRVMRHLTGMSEVTYVRLANYAWIFLLVLINIPQFRHVMTLAIIKLSLPFFWLAENTAGLVYG